MAKLRFVFNTSGVDDLVLDDPDSWDREKGLQTVIMPIDAEGNFKVYAIPLTSIRFYEYSGKEGEFPDDSDVEKDVKCRIKRPKLVDEGPVIDDLLNLGKH
jgi:hypothetical protein